MARTIHWPTAALAVPKAPVPSPPTLPPTLLETLDSAGLVAALGPELTRLFSTRISAIAGTPPPAKQPVKMFAAGRIRLSTTSGPAPIDISIEGIAANILIERLFGSRPSEAGGRTGGGADRLIHLPPGSGSWISLCRFLTTAVTRAMATAGHGAAGPAALAPRAADPASPQGAICLPLGLDIDGAQGRLTLSDPSAPAQPQTPEHTPEPPPLPDAQLWRRRARARTLQLELPVALRLADTRLLLSEVAALRPGDVIPLARPRALGVLVGGQRLADIPANRLLHTGPEEPGS
ncbi:MAG: FliM/FliN family flagellar motor switch protein [Sandarakinorhabdus sp.]|nr:FliM/FliN family flagellar motor switch protein [Sandarakinorhabdus sp.]